LLTDAPQLALGRYRPNTENLAFRSSHGIDPPRHVTNSTQSAAACRNEACSGVRRKQETTMPDARDRAESTEQTVP
jgi:hypothetical protein